MSINLRLYGDQIYPNISNYLTKYISPEITKEDFITMYKSGHLEFKNLSLKEAIFIHPQISIEQATINNLEINIPEKDENFGTILDDVKCLLIVSDINENEIEKILIEDKKKLINEFINYSVKKIEKKDGASFFDNIIKNILEQILNGLTINFKNLELTIKSKNKPNVEFIFFLENFDYSISEGIKIKNINIIYRKDDIKINIIEKFDIIVDIKSSEEEGKPNQINIKLNDAILKLNKDIYLDILNICDIFGNVNYKKIYIKYKKLILFKKNGDIDEKKDYKYLWFYAIKTVLKLQKYLKNNQTDIFDLTNSCQIKLVTKYLNDKNYLDNLLLCEDNNLLKATKSKVEKQVIENKNSNVLANAFSFFFGAKKEENNKELSEEEKEIFDEIYEDINIIKYLNKEIDNNNDKFNMIFDRIKSFLSKVSFNFEFTKLNLNLLNNNKNYDLNLFINILKFNLNYIEKQYELNFIIDDIGYKSDKSFFLNKNEENSIEISIDKNNNILFKIGFESIVLKDELFIGILLFFNSIKRKKKQKLFHEKNTFKKEEKDDKEKDNNKILMDKINNFSFSNNFKMTYIPSLIILSKDNKIEFKLNNYKLEENSINFSLNIKDSFGQILEDLPFNLIKNDKNITSIIENPIEIIFQKESLFSILFNYFEYNKEIAKINMSNINNIKEKNDDDELFKFNFIVYKNIDLGNIDFNEYNLNFGIKKIELKILKEKNILDNSFILEEIKLTYEKKNLKIYYKDCILKSDINSNIILYLFNNNENNNSKEIMINKDLNIEKKEQNVEPKYNYGKIASNIINNFSFEGKSFNIILNHDIFILSLNLNDIIILLGENKKDIQFSMNNWNINAIFNENKDKNFLKCDKKTILKIEFDTKKIKSDMDLIYFNMDLSQLLKIYEIISSVFSSKKNNINNNNKNDNLLKKQKNYNTLYKFELNINDIFYDVKRYKFSLSKININNKDNKLFNFNIIIKQLICQDLNNAKIINCNQLNIDCDLSPNNTKKVNINIDDTNFNLSQNDFLFLSYLLKSKEKNNYKKYYSLENEYIGNDLLNIKENIILNKNNENIYKTKVSMQEMFYQNNENIININISFPKIKLYLCKNITYDKLFELSMNNLNVKSYIASGNELFLSDNFNHNFSIQKIDLIYFQTAENIFNILSKRKEDFKENQVEFIYGNDNCLININNNEINLRIEAFLMIYYFFKENDLAEKSYNAMNEAINKKKFFQLNINNSKFQFCTSFNGKENLFLDINNLTLIYNNNINSKFPYGNYKMLLDKIFSNIISKNNVRKLFQTGYNFLEIEFNYYEDFISSNIKLGELLINLSYRDLVSFLRAYQLHLKLFNLSLKHCQELILEKDKNNINIPKKEEKNQSNIITPNGVRITRVITGELKFKKINIILIDDSRGSYQPFLNFDFQEMKIIINPDNSFLTDLSFILSSYNYIACVWEPTVEKLPIKLNGTFSKNKYLINMDIKTLLINLSDMSISFTLLIFNNWLTKLELKTKKFVDKDIILNPKNSNDNIQEPKSITKINNNKVINYTGIELNLIHNGKQILCPPLQKVELDNSDFNEIEKRKKIQHITLIYDKEHKYEIPLEKIISIRHNINNNLFIISENSLSENKTINISLYSPFVFKNQTPFKFKIQFSNRQFGNVMIDLNSNSICGLPLNLIIPNTYFCFYISEKNHDENNRTVDFNLDNIIKVNDQYKTKIDFRNKYFTMKVIKKSGNLRMLVIYSEYNIINCLPCDIQVDYFNKINTIEKCFQHHITDNIIDRLFISLGINTEYGLFTSDRINLLELSVNNEGSLVFNNNKYGKQFKLPYLFKKINEEKVFIIYSELIMYNNSGLNLNINFSDNNKLICFNVKDVINLISSNIDYKEEKLQLRFNNYFSKKINIHKLLEISNYQKYQMLDMNEQNPFDLIVKKKISYIKIVNNPNFKEKIISIIFTILPMCRIFNLLSTKKFIIADYENIGKRNSCWAIGPFERVNFQFFNKRNNVMLGLTATNLNSNNYQRLTKFQFKLGIYTLVADDDYIYNLDIKKSPTAGCIDVFVLENNISNSQVILENLSNEGFTIYQKNYEKNVQILYPKDIAPLKIYDFYNKEFYFDTNVHNIINLNNIRNNQKVYKLSEKSLVLFQDNGIKMKITFYEIEKYNSAKSSLIYLNYNIFIKTIYVSVVGDNEIKHPKLTKYNRYELLLLYLTNFHIILNIEQTIGLLNKNSIMTKIYFDKLKIFNMLSSEGKFACILENEETPCLYIDNKINYYRNQKILKLERQEIIIKKLKLGIDPDFWRKYLNFYDNVLYRMDLTYLDVHKIFLYDHDDDPKRLIKKHLKSRLLIYASDLIYPELNIEFEVAEKGLSRFLRERFACSDFYIWLAKGLVGNKHHLNIEQYVQDFNNGTIIQYSIWLYYEYLKKVEENLIEMGFKGFFGQFKNILTLDLFNEDQRDGKFLQKRIREIRPFYGKFKYFKEYDADDANLLRNAYSYDRNGTLSRYYPTKIIKGKNSFFLFTTICLILIDSYKYNIMWNIDYFSVKYAEAFNNNVKVNYNQKIDNYDSCTFKCENNIIAKEVAQSLNEETENNKYNILEI